MNFALQLPGPHDIPFAAPIWAAVIIGLVVGFFIFKLLDLFIKNPE
jgi:hypothetical protein